ncbi:Histone deacetylase [Hondaea fermentalgiana]|uniref:Histone deacetylase n=1 Tax=Hondaea fermentalgiana TaxID=2315210 RepID=A0A2R5GP20_9STRA|nr:Histone deacetylase [Hondaea fermentalgiana]|eukprot:GBG30061.1 Histone deacetylase [Hondaea fermentalgiana]
MGRKVAYVYDETFAYHHYGPGHPMKPARLMLAHNLVLTYGLHRKMDCFRPHRATAGEMMQYHSPEYIDFIRRASPSTAKALANEAQKFNMGEGTDCPIFNDMFDFCSLYSGGSLDGAVRLNHGLSDICINWPGGLHHAKKTEGSGFCYVNDIVLAILEMLKFHPRVLYIDIDIHHGDGVEEAFYMTDRVMTCSFHKFGDFFPGTGELTDTGSGKGAGYCVNFPLKEGMTDQDFARVFKPIIRRIMEIYRPGAVVLQCGADSLTGDRLGCFNLTVDGHAECVRFVKSFGVPLLLVGGGGYTVNNVARCWAFETAVAVGEDKDLSAEIPAHEFSGYFAPGHRIHLTPKASLQNNNTKEYLEKYKNIILQNLQDLQGAPSVAMQELPPEAFLENPEAAGVVVKPSALLS